MNRTERIKLAILDRDGVLNDNSKHYYIYQPAQWTWNPDIFQAMRALRDAGYSLALFTNQGGVSKGLYSLEDAYALHDWMKLTLKEEGIDLLDIMICPHHSAIESCLCRKPQSLLLDRLISKYQADKEKSILIGDSERDILAANQAGITSYLVPSNQSIWNLCTQIAEKEMNND